MTHRPGRPYHDAIEMGARRSAANTRRVMWLAVSGASGSVQHLFFRVHREQIGYIRFVVEAYEGLAQVTSFPGRGEVQWIVPQELCPQAEALARALADEIGLWPIPRPPDWPG